MKQYNKSIKGKLFNYFQQVLNIKQSTNGWWRCNCSWCGGTYTMGISLERNFVHCFKCGENKSPVELLMDLENFEILSQAYKFLSIQQEYEAYEKYIKIQKVDYEPIELPQGFNLLNLGDNAIAKAARHYMKKRGFNIDELSSRGIGYCTQGEYFGYIIFPFYRKGELIYYQGRIFMGVGPKMKNPVESQFGIGKSQVIFNQDCFYIYKRVYVLESITNALTLGNSAGAIQGKSISTWQMSALIGSPCEKAVIILDPDAYEQALELGLQLVNYKKTKVVKLPNTCNISGHEIVVDVNAIGKKLTLKFVKKTPYQSYMDLYKLKLNAQRPFHTY